MALFNYPSMSITCLCLDVEDKNETIKINSHKLWVLIIAHLIQL